MKCITLCVMEPLSLVLYEYVRTPRRMKVVMQTTYVEYVVW